jgi:hypothetical protein
VKKELPKVIGKLYLERPAIKKRSAHVECEYCKASAHPIDMVPYESYSNGKLELKHACHRCSVVAGIAF